MKKLTFGGKRNPLDKNATEESQKPFPRIRGPDLQREIIENAV